ncbi:hypothetical protein ASZ90_017765 [hydrocarbon metagenome]|uniref:Uncharacterized protein n=1 Tax=hydrocarbon metagenome TaxID=938273 RepID=A0A0W8E8C7_9ZZZZ
MGKTQVEYGILWRKKPSINERQIKKLLCGMSVQKSYIIGLQIPPFKMSGRHISLSIIVVYMTKGR